MTIQKLRIGKRRFVLLAESDFQQLQKKAKRRVVRPEFALEAMRGLRAYRKTRKAADWPRVKRRLGL